MKRPVPPPTFCPSPGMLFWEVGGGAWSPWTWQTVEHPGFGGKEPSVYPSAWPHFLTLSLALGLSPAGLERWLLTSCRWGWETLGVWREAASWHPAGPLLLGLMAEPGSPGSCLCAGSSIFHGTWGPSPHGLHLGTCLVHALDSARLAPQPGLSTLPPTLSSSSSSSSGTRSQEGESSERWS